MDEAGRLETGLWAFVLRHANGKNTPGQTDTPIPSPTALFSAFCLNCLASDRHVQPTQVAIYRGAAYQHSHSFNVSPFAPTAYRSLSFSDYHNETECGKQYKVRFLLPRKVTSQTYPQANIWGQFLN